MLTTLDVCDWDALCVIEIDPVGVGCCVDDGVIVSLDVCVEVREDVTLGV